MIAFEEVAGRLATLGYIVTEDQRGAVDYAIATATERLRAELNRDDIPEALRYTHIDVAAGLFLQSMQTAAEAGADPSAPVKSISEGDVRVEYDTAASSTVHTLITELTNPPEKILAAYRRFKW